MIKIKISMTFVYKEYEVKIKNGSGAITTAKKKCLLSCIMKIVI